MQRARSCSEMSTVWGGSEGLGIVLELIGVTLGELLTPLGFHILSVKQWGWTNIVIFQQRVVCGPLHMFLP